MIFPVLETEKVVQIGDMTRLSAVKSFVSKDEDDVTKVEICPETQEDPEDNEWIEVTGSSFKDWYLDWKYSGASRAISAAVRVTTTPAIEAVEDDPETEEIDETVEAQDAVSTTLSQSLSLLTAEDDHLFSGDQDLIAFEPDILKWVSEGRSSFLNVHRAAQGRILETLDESGVVDKEGNKLTKDAMVDLTEVTPWSRDLTLSLIFQGLSNAVDDVFSEKSKYYAGEALKRKARAVLRLDVDGDGEINKGEGVPSMQSVELFRR